MKISYQDYLSTLTKKQQMVAREAVARYLDTEAQKVTQIIKPEDSYMALRYMETYEDEHAVLLLLNARNDLIKTVEISKGGRDTTLVDIRVVAREALLANATSVIFAHNHPTGNITPSRQDEELTTFLNKGLNTLKIRLLDSVIVGHGRYYSFKENGRI